MANFCSKCGKPLSPGEVHNCEEEIREEIISDSVTEGVDANEVIEEVNESVTEEVLSSSSTTNTTSNIDLKASSSDCVNAIKKIFTKPVEAIKEFVSDNNFVAGIIMMVVTAIAAGIFRLASLKRAYDAVNNSWFSSPEPEYLKEFFTITGKSLLEYALIAVIGYVIITMILKGKATWKQMVAAVGLSLSLVLIAHLVNSILVFIDEEFITYIMNYITSFAAGFSVLVLFAGVKEVAGIDKNKLFLSVPAMMVLATVVMDIINKLFD